MLVGAIVIGVIVFLDKWAVRAQAETDKRAVRMGLYLTFGIFGFFILLLGLGLSLLSSVRDEGADPQAIWFIIVGVLTGLVLIPSTRRVIGRIIPFNATSYYDSIGLILIFWAVTLRISSFFVDADQSDVDVTYGGLVVQALLLSAIAFFAVGVFTRRSPREAAMRLGLVRPTQRQVVIAVAIAAGIVVASTLATLLVDLLQPELLDDLKQTLEETTEGLDIIWAAILIGLTAAVGEELLFRGAIQPRYGLVFTAIIFAFLHVQYHPAIILVSVLPAGIILGFERKYLNTTACIITHAIFNFIAVLLS